MGIDFLGSAMEGLAGRVEPKRLAAAAAATPGSLACAGYICVMITRRFSLE